MNRPEILAPAGSMEVLIAAIQSGADAVYCSGKNFGARAFAPNFTNEEIIEASKYVHLRNKKIYITVNTIVFEEEFLELKKYLAFLVQYVDGVIVQDLGIIHYIRKTYPDFPVHISTQANIHNVLDAKFYQKLGAYRIVLAREVPYDVLEEIMKLGIEVEVFVHGALCFSYSGNCYLSKMFGNRSGNRGSCAQPCRKKYSLYEDNKLIAKDQALLSMKDLNVINNIDKLCELGVHSLKIEGRMKSKEYVSVCVKAYRKAIDNYYLNKKIVNLDLDTLKKLKVTFNREFTKGYLFGETNNKIVNSKSVNHQGIVIGQVISSKFDARTNLNIVKIKLSDELNIHDGLRIKDVNSSELGIYVTKIIKDFKSVKSANIGDVVDVEVKNKVGKNSLVIKTSDARISKELDETLQKENVFNNLKGKLEIKKNNNINNIVFQISYLNNTFSSNLNVNLDKAIKDVDKNRIIAQLNKVNSLPFKYENIEIITDDDYFIPIKILNELRNIALNKLKEFCEKQMVRKYIEYPYQKIKIKNTNQNILINKYYKDIDYIAYNKQIDFYLKEKHVDYVNHVSELERIINKKNSAISPVLIVANFEAIEFIRNFTNSIIYLSQELPQETIFTLANYDANLGIICPNYEIAMVANHCIVSSVKGYSHKHCNECLKHQYFLETEDKKRLDLHFEDCQMYIINNKNLAKEDLEKEILYYHKHNINNFLIQNKEF